LFSVNARQSVNASGACGKELETSRLTGFCFEDIMKRCSKCGKKKQLIEFMKNKNRPNGVGSWCKKCKNEHTSKWQKDNPEKAKEKHRKWRAANPERWREILRKWNIANPDNARERTQRYRTSNLEKARESVRKWYAANREKVSEIKRKYQTAHPEKNQAIHRNRYARKIGNGGKITAQEWKALKEFYNFTCLCCKRREPEINLALDHVMPLALGGKNIISNAQPLCKSCNSKKHAKYIDYR
jgi:5-methylcytosine-specific restriction endonuclease McrA